MARQNHKRDNLSFVNQDAIEYLKHTDKIFDVLIMSHILEHLDNPSEFLKSVSGSFKRIYIEVPDFEATPLNLVRVDVGSKLIYTDEDHVTEFDRVELERIIAMSGLTIFKSNYSSGLLRVWCRHG